MHATAHNLAPQTARTPDPREVLDEAKKRQILNLLRLGCYEIHYTNTPVKVVIDEAVELAKRFGGAQSAQFVNELVVDQLPFLLEEVADVGDKELSGLLETLLEFFEETHGLSNPKFKARNTKQIRNPEIPN